MTPLPQPTRTRLAATLERELEERRFSALAAAVREHQHRGAAQAVRGRPHDDALYRRLLELRRPRR
jgi:hypothetical protein